MNLLISEYSSGFADSTYPLCNELANYRDLKITYLSDKNNEYMGMVNSTVKKEMLFDTFANDDRHRRGSLRWAVNRVKVAISNCKKRNRYVREHKPDIVLVELTMASVDCHFIRWIKKYSKIVYTVHDVVVPMKSMSWSRSSLKKMYDTADVLVVHTYANQKQLMSDFSVPSEKVVVIPHGVDEMYRKLDKADCRRELGIGDDEKVLLFYGGIRESKGLDILLEAMKGMDIVLIIAGAIPYGGTFDSYRRQIQNNRIRTVEYLEFTEDSFRDILFQAADFLVLPYKEFSSQSGVLMQGIRYRLPVIATDVGSFKEYIERYGIGYCCGACSVGELRKAIDKAFEDKIDFEGNMEMAAKENNWRNSGKKYRDLFMRIGIV